MSNPFLTFLAGRKIKQPEHIANESQPVTRKEFAVVAAAVQALIEDFDTATSPGKLKGVINSALLDVANAAPTPAKFTAPKGDDELGDIMPPRNPNLATVRNAQSPGRKPLALAPDRAFLAPKGD